MVPNYKIQINYIEKIVKLKLKYSYRLFSKENINVQNALNNYCDIYRKTDLYSLKNNSFLPGGEKKWNKLVVQISHLLNKKKYNDLNNFIKKSYDILRPRLIARCKKKYTLTEYNKIARFGCFDYGICDEKIDLHMPVFQFINHKLKKSSIKKNKSLMRLKDLLNLVQHAIKNYPNCKIIQCGTWMNTYYPFRKLFPPSWKPTQKYKNKNSIAWWGQFVDVTGNIHKKNTSAFIKNLKFPYLGEFYECDIFELKDFIFSSIKK